MDNVTPWTPFFTGLPNSNVTDLEIYYPTGKIRAGTYGRGLWESDLFVATPCANATIAYLGSPFCANLSEVNVHRTGSSGGVYSSMAGLTINASTGTITPTTSTVGTYTVTYTIAASGSCAAFSTTANLSISTTPAALFNITSNINSGSAVYTAEQITATNQISNANVLYKAVQFVLLSPGFSAVGNTFKASIGGCN